MYGLWILIGLRSHSFHEINFIRYSFHHFFLYVSTRKLSFHPFSNIFFLSLHHPFRSRFKALLAFVSLCLSPCIVATDWIRFYDFLLHIFRMLFYSTKRSFWILQFTCNIFLSCLTYFSIIFYNIFIFYWTTFNESTTFSCEIKYHRISIIALLYYLLGVDLFLFEKWRCEEMHCFYLDYFFHW